MVPNPLFQKLRDGSDFELDGLCLIQQGLNELSDHISKRDQRINELEYDIEEVCPLCLFGLLPVLIIWLRNKTRREMR